jgi:phosphoglycerol transferase MdoB-like AlkP superfamily enzyme
VAESEDTQGVVDGYFLQETAEILLDCPKKFFTAHLMTVTTHSPWTVPVTFRSPFEDPMCRAFHYLDSSVEAFMEIFRKSPRFAETLFIVVADHTSAVFGSDLLERLRIPLIFYHPDMERLKLNEERKVYGSHVDILPTTLTLLGGKWPYSGMGKNLLTLDSNHCFAISGSAYSAVYLKDTWVLYYQPHQKDSKLFLRDKDEIVFQDISQERKEIFSQLQREYLALYETARYLSRAQKVFPVKR